MKINLNKNLLLTIGILLIVFLMLTIIIFKFNIYKISSNNNIKTLTQIKKIDLNTDNANYHLNWRRI